jgi:putative membrane protein
MKFKKIAAVLVALMILAIPLVSAAEADSQSGTVADSSTDEKNETVYAILGYDGSVGEIYVVNQLMGEYTDYGSYTDIKNLSTASVPVVDGDKITFPDADVDDGLYYQGTMEGELPIKLSIQYYLNGKAVDGDKLGGSSGHVEIAINCAQNESCDERIREGLTTQIMLSLDMGLAKNVKADGATTVITGNTMSVSFTVLPKESGSFTVEADVSDFEMDAVSVTLVQANMGSYEDSIGEYEDGFDDMLSGADDMVDGTTELKGGVAELADGMGDLSSGLSQLDASGSDMISGMEQYGTGLQSYTQGVSGMASASEDIQSGLNTLAENGTALSQSLSQISDSVGSMASNAELYALAQSLASSDNPEVRALANGTLAMLDGLGGVSGGLSQVSDGVSGYTAGVQQAASGYGEFNAGLSQLAASGDTLVSGYSDIADGIETYTSGVSSSAVGAKKIYRALNGLPDNIQELIDGQIEFRDGISTAKDELVEQTKSLSGSAPVSFASPDKNHPQSVQYILMTPAIERTKASTQTDDTQDQETFFTRVQDLFN